MDSKNYSKTDPQYEYLMAHVHKDPMLHNACYNSNNRYAYFTDINDEERRKKDLKMMNFVPAYDGWCLYCDKKSVTKKCSGCKTVFFCDQECQKKAWPIHKKHCGRDQFDICCSCGIIIVNKIKCDQCPVSWCSQECKDKLYDAHKEYDCDIFSDLFK